ncbi:MAG: efflux RND transporter periplasmic adaptor subunit, partial [Longimicrobiales bacterium]|nr:efflux RND transporter periplasmic adaptor subunit [Longimicrobiales bacterium]
MTSMETLKRAGAAAVLSALALVGCSESSASDGSANGASDQVAVAERGDLDIRVEAAGQVEPILVVEVKSKASGEVTDMHVETGDEVDRGDLLAEVDPRDVRNALAQARADLEVAQARVQIARSQADRSRELREANVVTQQELEQSILELANARAALTRAETNLELARERMGDVTIRAPIGGTIIEKPVEAGTIISSASANVSGGTTLMTMADLSTMQVRTLVDETDIGKVESGQAARVQVEAYPNRSFIGTVYKIEPQAVVDQNVTMFPVLVRLDNEERLLKPNMNAEVQIEVAQRQDVVLVPNAAVVGMNDAVAAGAVLGLSPDAVREQMRRTVPRADATETAGGDGEADASGPGAGGEEDCGSLMARARADRSSLSDEDRTRVRECFQQMGGPRGMRSGAPSGSGETRPAVVFV